jgi:hypothetical protein
LEEKMKNSKKPHLPSSEEIEKAYFDHFSNPSKEAALEHLKKLRAMEPTTIGGYAWAAL